jgi:hypothetical protein
VLALLKLLKRDLSAAGGSAGKLVGGAAWASLIRICACWIGEGFAAANVTGECGTVLKVLLEYRFGSSVKM